jgi:hypothetical protein
MSEHLSPANRSEGQEDKPGQREGYPTEAELQEFERAQDSIPALSFNAPIEDFARDPQNPTLEEIRAMEVFNSIGPKLYDLTFEDHFGYSDPRDSQGEQSQPKMPKPESQPDKKYPSEEGLQEFQAYQRSLQYMTIEEFANDPEHPTEDEIAAVEELNKSYGAEPLNFEEYFGYPDPREAEPEHERQDDQHP